MINQKQPHTHTNELLNTTTKKIDKDKFGEPETVESKKKKKNMILRGNLAKKIKNKKKKLTIQVKIKPDIFYTHTHTHTKYGKINYRTNHFFLFQYK